MKKIFFLTGVFPVVQLLTLLTLGIASLFLAFNLRVGKYVSFEGTIKREGAIYILEIPQANRKQVNKESVGLWAFNSIQGKRYPISFSTQKKAYILDINKLNSKDSQRLEATKKVYADFMISSQPLLGVK